VDNFNIDWDFISAREGGQKLNGYHPTMKSGVTIATGIDLKEKNRGYFEKLGVSKETIDVLEPFFGLTGEEAKEQATQLKVTKAMAVELDKKIKTPYAKEVAATYEKFSNGKKFTDLSRRKQTVLVSVGFQYGAGFYRADKKTRMNFIQQAGRDEWDAVYDNLMDFGDNFGPRRELEAEYLKPDLTEKKAEAPKIQAQPFADEESQAAFFDIMANSSIKDNDYFLKQLDTEIGFEKLSGPWRKLYSNVIADTKMGSFSASVDKMISEEGYEEPERYSLQYKNGGFSASMLKQDEYEEYKLNFRKKF